MLGEDLRLAERRHREADRTLAELEPGDLGRLVGLHVRTQRQPVRRGPLRGAAYVAAEPVEVDAEVRRGRRAATPLRTPRGCRGRRRRAGRRACASAVIAATSSSVSSKPSRSRFSRCRDGVARHRDRQVPSWSCQRSTTWPGETPCASAAALTTGSANGACRLPIGLHDSVSTPSSASTARISACGKYGCSSIWLSTGVTPVSSMTFVQMRPGEVGDAGRAHQPVVAQLDQRPPGLVVLLLRRVRPVDEVHVDPVQPQPLQGLAGAGDRVVVRVVPTGDLAGHHDLVAGHAGAPDRLADLGLVAVVHGRVDQPVAVLERTGHGRDRVVAAQTGGAEADRRDGGAVVELAWGGRKAHASTVSMCR